MSEVHGKMIERVSELGMFLVKEISNVKEALYDDKLDVFDTHYPYNKGKLDVLLEVKRILEG